MSTRNAEETPRVEPSKLPNNTSKSVAANGPHLESHLSIDMPSSHCIYRDHLFHPILKITRCSNS